jgi:hypothetical protein
VIKPVTKAVLFALAVQCYGPTAWTWGIWINARKGLEVKP